MDCKGKCGAIARPGEEFCCPECEAMRALGKAEFWNMLQSLQSGGMIDIKVTEEEFWLSSDFKE